MKLDELRMFRCIRCRNAGLDVGFTFEAVDRQASGEGVLNCERCGSVFQITRGIARFVPEDNYAKSFGFQWNTHEKTQLDSFSGLTVSRDRVFAVTGWPESLVGERVLEAGSGAGRFSEILLETGASVFSFDYSSACEANLRNNNGKGKGSFTVFQGDIFDIPLAKSSFDKVFCLGVLQHTPDPERAFRSLVQYVRPGGSLAIDIYTKSIGHWLQWKYLLRPITTRMNQLHLYSLISNVAPVLVPVAASLHRLLGRFGRRLLPIVQYSHLGLPPELNVQWAILDTFDMYAPKHDHPKTVKDVRLWFEQAGFCQIDVRHGPNGVIGTGVRPL